MFEGKPRNVCGLGGGGCTQILRFAQDDRWGFARDDTIGEGGLVSWSVGQLVSFYARTYLCVVS